MPSILYFTEKVRNPLQKPVVTSRWVRKAIRQEGGGIKQLNYIFCNDPFLKDLNQRFLRHRYFTDIITFDYSEDKLNLEGDIYISLDRVRENCKLYKVSFQEELHRVLIHGALHLLGYSDKTKAAKAQMREKEDAYLSLR